MDDNKALASENARLREALKKIAEHQAQIQKILDGVSDLLRTNEQTESAPVTDEDVKELLKKYSRLH
ncbi:hypothetical protein [uncultured Ruminococcus sp.]|uniref:hypothetical protein n=1 Tax=uncultured Ruminococcus sp. TaxID=165186 RepID=UPI0029301FF4|nr:hypothetical protein [uncultured Ruminococcus sp.]